MLSGALDTSTSRVIGELSLSRIESKSPQDQDSASGHVIQYYEEREKVCDLKFQSKIEALKTKATGIELKVFEDGKAVPIEDLEAECNALLTISKDRTLWQQLTEDERITLEKYKLILMRAVQESFQEEAEEPPKKNSWGRWFVFGLFIALEFVPAIWGGYLGVTALMAPWMSEAAASIVGLAVCGIEALLYYAVMGPLLKEALGISDVDPAKPRLEIYGKQLSVLKSIDKVLTVNNKMKAADYKKYMRLATLFSESLGDLQETDVYIKTGFDEINLRTIKGEAFVVVGKEVRMIKNQQYLQSKNAATLTLALDKSEVAELIKLKRDLQGRVLRAEHRGDFLNEVLKKLRTQIEKKAHPKMDSLQLPRFKESFFKAALRWTLAGLNVVLNVGGGYFFALALLAGSTATIGLIGTPLGWGIIALVILGQLALRLAVRSNAMFSFLNPGAEKHEDVRKKINSYEFNTENYKKTLTEKEKTEEMIKRLSRLEEQAKNKDEGVATKPASQTESKNEGITNEQKIEYLRVSPLVDRFYSSGPKVKRPDLSVVGTIRNSSSI